jgi:hypothetical protein
VTASSSATIEQVKCIELRGLTKVPRGDAGHCGDEDGHCGDAGSPTLLRNGEVHVANGTHPDAHLRVGASSQKGSQFFQLWQINQTRAPSARGRDAGVAMCSGAKCCLPWGSACDSVHIMAVLLKPCFFCKPLPGTGTDILL